MGEQPQEQVGDHGEQLVTTAELNEPVSSHELGHRAWMVEAYHKLTYPIFEPTAKNIQAALGYLAALNGDRVVDLGALRTQFEVAQQTMAENLCLIDFEQRSAAHLIAAFPKDHKSALNLDGGGVPYPIGADMTVANRVTVGEYSPTGETNMQQWVKDPALVHPWQCYFEAIQLSLRQNPGVRTLLEKLQGSSDAQVARQVQRLETLLSEKTSASEYMDEARRVVQNGKILRGDIFKRNFGIPIDQFHPFDVVNAASRRVAFDVVTSNFTTEAAAVDKPVEERTRRWQQAIANLLNAVKGDGFLKLSVCTESEKYYTSDTQSFELVNVKSEEIRDFIQAAGFRELEYQETTGGFDKSLGYNRIYTGLFRAPADWHGAHQEPQALSNQSAAA